MTVHRESVSPTGLCVTCDHMIGCMHLRAATAPVWHCEEYQDVPPAIDAVWAAGDPVAPNEGTIPAPATRIRGICQTCADAATCRLPRAEGGVWWCEEYR